MALGMAFLARPLLFAIDAETAHGLTIDMLAAWGAIGAPFARRPASLPVAIAGLTFPNPLGLAAGADKEGRRITEGDLEALVRTIREEYPQMPGVAFYGHDDGDPGTPALVLAADDMASRLYPTPDPSGEGR